MANVKRTRISFEAQYVNGVLMNVEKAPTGTKLLHVMNAPQNSFSTGYDAAIDYSIMNGVDVMFIDHNEGGAVIIEPDFTSSKYERAKRSAERVLNSPAVLKAVRAKDIPMSVSILPEYREGFEDKVKNADSMGQLTELVHAMEYAGLVEYLVGRRRYLVPTAMNKARRVLGFESDSTFSDVYGWLVQAWVYGCEMQYVIRGSSIEEVARRRGVSEAEIRRDIRAGRFNSMQIDGRTYVYEGDDAYSVFPLPSMGSPVEGE